MKSFFIFAGELSGDLHGSHLVHALKEQLDDITFSGISGPDLRALGIHGPLQMEDFMVMGFSDVIKCFPRLLWQFRQVRNHILETQPDVAIFIDSPSFSLPMAKSLRKAGYKGKIVQYICPTVWAWGKNRIQKLAHSFDLLLTIYPFEAQYFANTSLNVQYIGNPVREAIHNHAYDPHWKEKLKIPSHHDIIAIFPGSRGGEVSRNLPAQLEAAGKMIKVYPQTLLAISCAHNNLQKSIQSIIKEQDLKLDFEAFLVPKEHSYDLMQSSRSAIAKSGTVTLELALHQCPTVVTYKLSLMNKLIAKHILKVNLPRYCIVNILKNEMLFPELITETYTPDAILKHLIPLHESSKTRDHCLNQCISIKQLFQELGVSSSAANAILKLI